MRFTTANWICNHSFRTNTVGKVLQLDIVTIQDSTCAMFIRTSVPNPPNLLQLPSLLPPILPILIPQQPPQNLPTGTLRNHINKLHPTRQPLMPTLLLLDIFTNLPARHRFTLLQPNTVRFHNVRFGDFTAAFVRHGDHGAVGHGRVVEEAGFQLRGGDLHALFFHIWLAYIIQFLITVTRLKMPKDIP